MRIDRLTRDDWRRYRAIRLSALRDSPDAFASTFAREDAFGPQDWQGRLDGAMTCVGVVDGTDAGMATGAAWDDRPGVAGLFGMWVAPGGRRCGLGRALIGDVVDWARAQGFNRVALEVADQNAPAIALYAAMGFQATGQTTTLPPPRAHITEHERVLVL